ncbi:TonB-dependent receptor [Thalassotalea psychrophila]|uniref:TonB-dependent receptor n=1 Tax=Thalassotalea psychrophila TaxID=3065647 RepID=A0ABY9TZB2_9GAMM|nr:TonB-dependent receptor [Colwelliaceae bacterium SQ149]
MRSIRKTKLRIAIQLAVLTSASSISATTLAANNANDAAQTRQLEHIIVTSQKRSQNLQEVPMSVSAIGGEKIKEAAIPNLEDLSSYIPNFSVAKSGGTEVISIRGIQTGFQSGFEQSIGTYVDGVYRGRGVQSQFSFLDVGLVEVLRGPQGTLFGKNTIGGALNITTAKPTEDFEASVSLSHEFEYEQDEVQGFVSGSLTDNLRGRVAFLARESDEGWVENSYYDTSSTTNEDWASRLSLEWDASEDTLVSFKVEHGDWDKAGLPMEHDQLSPGLQFLMTAFSPTFPVEPDLDTSNLSAPNGNSSPEIDVGNNYVFEGDIDEIALTIEHNLDNGSVITAIAGYSTYEFDRSVDADYSLFDGLLYNDTEDFEQSSFELRIASDASLDFNYVAGVYFEKADLYADAVSNFNVDGSDPDSLGSVLALQNPLYGMLGKFGRVNFLDQESTSSAVFFQGTYALTEAVKMTAGVRYSDDKKEAEQGMLCSEFGSSTVDQACSYPDPTDPFAPIYAFRHFLSEMTPHVFEDLERNEENVSWSANLQWQATNDAMLYGSISTGYKSGGFNSFTQRPDPDEVEFDEEEAQSIEVGAKLSLDDGAAELNIAIYQMEYDDLQASIFTGATAFKVENAAKADISGVEMDGRWLLTDSLTLRGSLAYNNFEFDDYDTAGCTVDQKTLADAGNVTPGVRLNALGLCEQDLAGKPNAFTPEWTGSLSLEHELNFDNYYLRSVLDLNYRDNYYAAADLDPISEQDSYVLTNLSLIFGPQSQDWDIALIGRNLGDEQFKTWSQDIPLFAGSHMGLYSQGQTFTLRGSYHFQ